VAGRDRRVPQDGDSNTLEEIQFDRGWSNEKLQEELFKREVILAYLIKKGLNTYAEVAATVQAFINDPETILTLIANGQLEDSLEDLREMESVLIDVDPEKRSSSRVRTRAARRTTSRWTSSSSGPKSPYSRSIGGRSRAASRERPSATSKRRARLTSTAPTARSSTSPVRSTRPSTRTSGNSAPARRRSPPKTMTTVTNRRGSAKRQGSPSAVTVTAMRLLRARPTLLPQPMRVRRTVGPTPAVVRPRSSRHPLSMKLRTLPPRAAVHNPRLRRVLNRRWKRGQPIPTLSPVRRRSQQRICQLPRVRPPEQTVRERIRLTTSRRYSRPTTSGRRSGRTVRRYGRDDRRTG